MFVIHFYLVNNKTMKEKILSFYRYLKEMLLVQSNKYNLKNAFEHDIQRR